MYLPNELTATIMVSKPQFLKRILPPDIGDKFPFEYKQLEMQVISDMFVYAYGHKDISNIETDTEFVDNLTSVIVDFVLEKGMIDLSIDPEVAEEDIAFIKVNNSVINEMKIIVSSVSQIESAYTNAYNSSKELGYEITGFKVKENINRYDFDIEVYYDKPVSFRH